ncbi:MAG TPA: EbsA family protein [Lactovum miscens]|uniref:EbsA family protein n=1 Tax=Lactovum miscens TaxID=190387 RepID=UPI002ED8F5DB
MEAGYFQPLNNHYKLAWIWWVILLSVQETLFYEDNMNIFTLWQISLIVFVLAYLYFLVRQRRFFVSNHHLYFTSDFRLRMQEFETSRLSSVKLYSNRIKFIYDGRYCQFVAFGSSHRLLMNALKENQVEYIDKRFSSSKKD